MKMNESPRELHLITGGAGYSGFNLAKKLAELGHMVKLFDVKKPMWDIPENVEFVEGDIRNSSDVEEAFKSVDCAYHLASYGMSGREQLNTKLIEEINVLGTKNVIKACCKCGVTRLVYTSTYNVVFGGQVIENGDESQPYLPLDKHPDHYSRTKALAEMEIMKANGMSISGDRVLNTCSLRLAGIYGPGEQRHLPRIVLSDFSGDVEVTKLMNDVWVSPVISDQNDGSFSFCNDPRHTVVLQLSSHLMGYLEMGLFRFTYGKDSNLVDFLHVDNLVQAHILAGQALSEEKDHIAAGQVYFISDDKPVNNFEFFRPMVEGLGYDFPSVKLPMMWVYFFAYITECLHYVIGRIYNFQPMLTRTEVYKTGVTHFFSTGKAKKDLGYIPLRQNDMEGIVEYFQKLGRVRSRKPKSGFHRVLINILLVIFCAVAIMAFLPMVV